MTITCTYYYWVLAFSSLARIWGKWSTIHFRLRFLGFFFFSVEIKSRILIPLFRPWSVHSGSANWEDQGRVFPDELRVSSFPDRFPHYTCGIVSPHRLCWVKGVCVFSCNLPPALVAECPGSFTSQCSNTGMERTLHKSQHTKLTLKRKILPPLLLGFKLTTFRSPVRRSTDMLSRLLLWVTFIIAATKQIISLLAH